VACANSELGLVVADAGGQVQVLGDAALRA
jgi:hypothetical protein